MSDTIARFSTLRATANTGMGGPLVDRLADLTDFGSNPGALRGRTFVPAGLAPGAALVVVLHGCTQTAAGYDHGSGWSGVADEAGFALLLPEQQRANNPNLCFNWFAAGDARRDVGEALSIRQMIDTMIARHEIDPARVFVTGLSAGGAMTAVMLAAYPELFAGGAVIAGLPYGTAWSIGDALSRMRGQGLPGEGGLATLARDAAHWDGRWPTLSVWHGDADHTVSPANADALIGQWRALHGVGAAPAAVVDRDGHRHRTWRDAAGRPVVEDHRIAGMGHGTPLDTTGARGCGVSGAHMLDVGVSSTRLIAADWGLVAAVEPAASVERPAADPIPLTRAVGKRPSLPALTSIEHTIDTALRAAGLMR